MGVETRNIKKKVFYTGIVFSDYLTKLVTIQKEVKGIYSNNDGNDDDDNNNNKNKS